MPEAVAQRSWRKAAAGFIRPRLTFSLRTLLLVVTAITVWLGWQSYLAREQREAVTVLRLLNWNTGFNRHNVIVVYDYDIVALQQPRITEPKVTAPPDFCSKVFGTDFLHRVESVEVRGGDQDRDVLLANLKRLPYLKQISFRFSICAPSYQFDDPMFCELQREFPNIDVTVADNPIFNYDTGQRVSTATSGKDHLNALP